MKELIAIVQSMDECQNEYQAAIEEAYDRFEAAIVGLLEEADGATRQRLAYFLYWHPRNFNVDWLCELLGLSRVGVRRLAGPFFVIRCCNTCNSPMEIFLRSRHDHGRYQCEACEAKREAKWAIEGAARQAAKDEEEQWREARLSELRVMPYRQYLMTPEWQDRRRKHLRAARYRCQLCNAKGCELNVHHRSYDQRGEEAYEDLIVLCRPCHDTFHEKQSLSIT